MHRHVQRSAQTFAIATTIAAITTGTGLLAGCGGGSGEAPSASAGPAVDSRVASADAVVDTFNTAAAARPYDLTTIVGLFVAETPQQEEMIGIIRDTLPMTEFALLLEEKFPGAESQILNAGRGAPPGIADSLGRASIIERSPQRATATVTGENGEVSDIMLVQLRSDGPWGISGYTLERSLEDDTDFQEVQAIVATPMFQAIVGMAREVMPDLNRRLRANEFETIQDVEQAYMQAFTQFGQNNPEFMQNLMGQMQQNPDFANQFGQ